MNNYKTKLFAFSDKAGKSIISIIISLITLFLIGCGGSSNYFFNEPTSKEIKIDGLEKNDEIVEISDSYKNVYTDGKEFWVTIQKEQSNYFIGKINFESGRIFDLVKLKDFDPSEQSIYWTALMEDHTGTATKVLNFIFGGGSKFYTFEGIKQFWSNTYNYVKVYYYWNDEHRVTYQGRIKTITDSENMAYALEFSDSSGSTFINRHNGYITNVNDNYNGKKVRILKINENLYLGVQPFELEPTSEVMFFVYEVNYANNYGISYGAKLPVINYPYVDAVINKEGTEIGIIYKSNKGYLMKKYSTNEFVKNIKSLKTD